MPGHRLDEPHDEPRRRRARACGTAACERTWNQRVSTTPGTTATSSTRPLRQSSSTSDTAVNTIASTLDGQRGDAAVEQLAQRVDVGGLPRDDPARRVLLVELQAEPLRVPEDPAPQVEQHRLAHPRRRTDGRRREHAAQQRGGEVARASRATIGRASPSVSAGSAWSMPYATSAGPATAASCEPHDERGGPPCRAGDGPQERAEQRAATGAGPSRLGRGALVLERPSEVTTLAGAVIAAPPSGRPRRPAPPAR